MSAWALNYARGKYCYLEDKHHEISDYLFFQKITQSEE